MVYSSFLDLLPKTPVFSVIRDVVDLTSRFVVLAKEHSSSASVHSVMVLPARAHATILSRFIVKVLLVAWSGKRKEKKWGARNRWLSDMKERDGSPVRGIEVVKNRNCCSVVATSCSKDVVPTQCIPDGQEGGTGTDFSQEVFVIVYM